jgi:hypothetical protein
MTESQITQYFKRQAKGENVNLQKKKNKRVTYSPSSVGLEDNEHGDVAPEGAPVLPHLAHHRPHALSLLGIERLRNPPSPIAPHKTKNQESLVKSAAS